MNEHEQTRLALAVLVGCQIRALSASDSDLVRRFSEELRKAHRSMKGWDSPPEGVLETLSWADEQARVPR